MSILDHGGFDILFEVADDAAGGIMRNRLTIPDTTQPFNSNGVQGTASVHVAPESVQFSNGSTISIDVSLAGSTLDLTAWPLPIALPTVDHTVNLDATVTIGDRVDAAALNTIVDTSPDAGHMTPAVTVTLDRAAVLASTPVMVLLGFIYLGPGGEAQMQIVREAILNDLAMQLTASVRATLTAHPIVQTLLAVPSTFAPPSPAPLLSTPGTQSPVVADTTIGSLRVGAALGSAPGNLNLITRSALRRSTTVGSAIDSVALIVSNACLLRDFVRPFAANALGLFAQPTGFLAGDPFFWSGSVTTTAIGGVPATITSALAFVNETGQLVVAFTFDASWIGGGITAHATVTTTINFSATSSSSGLLLTLMPQPPVFSSARVDIAWWVYLLTAVTLGTTGLAALAVADALLDGTLGATTVTVPSVSIAIPLPPGLPPVFVTGLSLFQPDAPRRTISFAGLTIPAPGRDHDLILSVALS